MFPQLTNQQKAELIAHKIVDMLNGIRSFVTETSFTFRESFTPEDTQTILKSVQQSTSGKWEIELNAEEVQPTRSTSLSELVDFSGLGLATDLELTPTVTYKYCLTARRASQ